MPIKRKEPPQTQVKLSYVSNTHVPSTDAQSKQILSMSKAFSHLLGNENFYLFSSRKLETDRFASNFNWVPVVTSPMRRQWRYFLFLPKIASILKKGHDVVYTRDILIAFLMFLKRIPVGLEIHNSFSSFFHKFIFRIIAKRISIIVISEALKNYIVDKFAVKKDSILVAHDGVEIGVYDQYRTLSKPTLRKKLGLPQKSTIVLHSGNLYPGRGGELFEIILREFPKIWFVSVGGTPDDIRLWKQKYIDFPNIRFLDHMPREDVVKYQMAADILFLPMTNKSNIWWCTSPMKLFEYMASGNIILSTKVGSISEILNRSNSLIFDPDSPAQIIERINYFLTHHAQCGTIAKNALALVRNKYTWKIRAEKIVKFINLKTMKQLK